MFYVLFAVLIVILAVFCRPSSSQKLRLLPALSLSVANAHHQSLTVAEPVALKLPGSYLGSGLFGCVPGAAYADEHATFISHTRGILARHLLGVFGTHSGAVVCAFGRGCFGERLLAHLFALCFLSFAVGRRQKFLRLSFNSGEASSEE